MSEYLSWPQAAEILTKVTGIPVKCGTLKMILKGWHPRT